MLTSVTRCLLSIVAAGLCQATSCMVTAEGLPGAGSDIPTGTEVSDDHTRIRFVNQTNYAVDVEFYATSATGSADEILFIEDNRVTDSVGFAGTGLITANATDEIELLCANAQTVGTTGGEFLDIETGESQGTGERRVLATGDQFDCEDTITFTFKDEDGEFGTSIALD